MSAKRRRLRAYLLLGQTWRQRVRLSTRGTRVRGRDGNYAHSVRLVVSRPRVRALRTLHALEGLP